VISVRVSVCLSDNLHILKTSKFTHICFTCYLWPQLGPRLIACNSSRCQLIPVLWMMSYFRTMEQIGHYQRWRVCFFQVSAPGAKSAVFEFILFSVVIFGFTPGISIGLCPWTWYSNSPIWSLVAVSWLNPSPPLCHLLVWAYATESPSCLLLLQLPVVL